MKTVFLCLVLFVCLTQVLSEKCGTLDCKPNECCLKKGKTNVCRPEPKMGEKCTKKSGCKACADGFECNPSTKMCDDPANVPKPNCGQKTCKDKECCFQVLGADSCVEPRKMGEQCIKWKGCAECDEGLTCNNNICGEATNVAPETKCGTLTCKANECCLFNSKTKKDVCRPEPKKGERCTKKMGCKMCAAGFECNPMTSKCDDPSKIPPPNCGKEYCKDNQCCFEVLGVSSCVDPRQKGEQCIKWKGCEECAKGLKCKNNKCG